jgi:hypothetical protein
VRRYLAAVERLESAMRVADAVERSLRKGRYARHDAQPTSRRGAGEVEVWRVRAGTPTLPLWHRALTGSRGIFSPPWAIYVLQREISAHRFPLGVIDGLATLTAFPETEGSAPGATQRLRRAARASRHASITGCSGHSAEVYCEPACVI